MDKDNIFCNLRLALCAENDLINKSIKIKSINKMEQRIKTYGEFYKFYLTEHSNKTCRLLHFIGTAFVFIIAFLALFLSKSKLWILVPIVGYGFAWVGHFYFEKNKPATFKYPLWSLFSDFKMFFQILTGKISIDSSKDSSVMN